MKTLDGVLLLTFDGIHDVIKAEKLLKNLGFIPDLVPTPRALSSDCGMSIECPAADREKLQALRDSGLLLCKGLYCPLA